MTQHFEDRGYSKSVLNRAINIGDKTPQDKLLQDKNRNKNNSKIPQHTSIPVFSTPFSTDFGKIRNIALRYLPVLLNDPVYTQIMSKGVKTVFCRAPTLGRTLSPILETSKKSCPHWLQFKGTFRCGSNGCPCCLHIHRGTPSALPLPKSNQKCHHSLIVILDTWSTLLLVHHARFSTLVGQLVG